MTDHARTPGTALAVALALSACSGPAEQPENREFGAQPALVEPDSALLPTVNPAKAVGWPQGAMPTPAPGLRVNAFAHDLDHPRWLHVLPNGDVLVAESRAPASSGGFGGIRGWFAKRMMKYAGAAGASADRITLLRDADGNGTADERSVLLAGLHSPFGMALAGDWLYVANADALVRFPYREGQLRIDAPPETVTALPGGPLNHHWTKNVVASADGALLYVAVGSNSNIGENGMDVERDRAAILEVDPRSGNYRVFADGLRNPVGMDWHPTTGELWTVVNERDELGDQLVPDYLARVRDGGFYGWPYSYWGQVVDARVAPQDPERVATALAPDYALGAHTASLGLAFYSHEALPSLAGAAIIGQHGSWNREPHSGYKVIAISFSDGDPAGEPRDILTGFLSAEAEAHGRPAGVAIAGDGAILVADDVGNTLWRVSRNTN